MGLAAIYRQEIIQDVMSFASQRAANFYDILFICLDFTLPRVAAGQRSFPKEAMLCAFLVMKCAGLCATHPTTPQNTSAFGDPTFAAYLTQKQAEGKHYNVALSHAANKFVRLIYAMEKSRQPYRTAA